MSTTWLRDPFAEGGPCWSYRIPFWVNQRSSSRLFDEEERAGVPLTLVFDEAGGTGREQALALVRRRRGVGRSLALRSQRSSVCRACGDQKHAERARASDTGFS